MASPNLEQVIGIDLHMHSTASDGSVVPADVVKMAHGLGLAAVSVTDHDTAAGQAEARRTAESLGVEYVTGIELSVEDSTGKYHLLGYGYDLASDALMTRLEDVRTSRSTRNEKMMRKIADSGLGLTWDDVLAEVGEGGKVVGRPHIAAAMIKKGLVGSTQEAFDRYLAEGQVFYLPKDALSSDEAVELIHSAGGIAVMAHPGLSRWPDPDALETQLVHAMAYGLDGLEVYYSQHSKAQTATYIEIADRLGLVKTGGSDFHGTPKPTVKIGVVVDGGPAPMRVLADVKRALAR